MSLKIMKNKWSNTYKLWSDEAYIETQQLWLLTTYTSYALFDIIWLENKTIESISKLSLKKYSNTLNSNKYLVSNAIKTPFYCAQNFEVWR